MLRALGLPDLRLTAGYSGLVGSVAATVGGTSDNSGVGPGRSYGGVGDRPDRGGGAVGASALADYPSSELTLGPLAPSSGSSEGSVNVGHELTEGSAAARSWGTNRLATGPALESRKVPNPVEASQVDAEVARDASV